MIINIKTEMDVVDVVLFNISLILDRVDFISFLHFSKQEK